MNLLLFSNITLPLEDPILKSLLVLGIILLAPLLLNKLKIPHLLGLIIAGAVIGPNGLNLILRDSSMELCDLPVQAVHIGEFLLVPQEMQQFHPTGLFVQVAGKVQQKRFCRWQLCFADSGLDSNIRNGIEAALRGVRP